MGISIVLSPVVCRICILGDSQLNLGVFTEDERERARKKKEKNLNLLVFINLKRITKIVKITQKIMLNLEEYKKSIIKRYDYEPYLKYFSYKDFKGLKYDECNIKVNIDVINGGFYYYNNKETTNNLIVFVHGIGSWTFVLYERN